MPVPPRPKPIPPPPPIITAPQPVIEAVEEPVPPPVLAVVPEPEPESQPESEVEPVAEPVVEPVVQVEEEPAEKLDPVPRRPIDLRIEYDAMVGTILVLGYEPIFPPQEDEQMTEAYKKYERSKQALKDLTRAHGAPEEVETVEAPAVPAVPPTEEIPIQKPADS